MGCAGVSLTAPARRPRPLPFACPRSSEFNYDSTGQEEVYIWLSYFGYQDGANRTLQSILGYMRSIPNWAWNGGARSIGDLGNNGKWFINRGTERVLM